MNKFLLSIVFVFFLFTVKSQVTVDPVIGSQRVAILPFDYAQDGTEIPISIIESGMFTASYSIKSFFEEISYGKTTIQGSVYPYRTNQPPLFGVGYTNCYPTDSVMINQPDVDYSVIDNIILFSHDTSSTASCAAGVSSSEKLPFNTADGFFEFRRSGFRTDFYFPNDFSNTTSSTIAHELMHSFGNAFHSNSYIQDTGQWVLQGYGNVFDILGLRSQATHPCSMIKHKLGWLTENEIIHVQQTDTFRIYALEKTLPGQTQALIIELDSLADIQPNDATQFGRLYLEYRGLTGLDDRSSLMRRVRLKDNTYHPNTNIHGVSIIGVDCNQGEDCLPVLIDTHPEPIGGVGAAYFPHEASDAPLLLGENYNVPNNDINIEVIYVNEGYYIDVAVAMPALSSLESVDLNGVSVFPSPMTDHLFINNPLGKNLSFVITDMNGRVVIKNQLTDRINVAHLEAGVYFVRIKELNGHAWKVEKVVKM